MFIILYGISHAIISTYKRRRDELDSGKNDDTVNSQQLIFSCTKYESTLYSVNTNIGNIWCSKINSVNCPLFFLLLTVYIIIML